MRCAHTHLVTLLRAVQTVWQQASWMGPSVEWSQKRELALLPLTWAFSPSPAALAREDKGPNMWTASALHEALSLPP